MSEGLCVICHREAEQGYLDAECFSRLASMLREIEDETAILEAVPSMAIRSGSGGGTLASHRSPAVLDAIVARDPRRGTGRIGWDDADPWGIDDTASVLETLHSRARTVREDLEYEPPARITITGERGLLTEALPWIAQQPWVDEMFMEMRDLLAQLKRTNKTQADKPVGRCYLIRFDNVCGGTIWQREQERMIWRQAESGGDRCVRVKVKVNDGPAYCERCRATWDDPKELDRLHLIEERRQAELKRPKTSEGQRMLTVAELAAHHGKTENAIRLRLSKAGARAVRGHYDPAVLDEERKSCA
jgi:Zn-finger nucleic acid-binding protein